MYYRKPKIPNLDKIVPVIIYLIGMPWILSTKVQVQENQWHNKIYANEGNTYNITSNYIMNIKNNSRMIRKKGVATLYPNTYTL